MSLPAKSTYMAAKAQLVMEKVQPIIDTYEDVCQMGVQLLQEVQEKIQLVTSKIAELIAIGLDYLSKAQARLLAQYNKQKERLMLQLQKLVTKVTALKDTAVSKIEDMASRSVTGISGVNLDINLTSPDPLTGTGGNISITPTPDLIDESTMLVDQTLTDPTTVTNSQVVVTGVAGPYTFTQVTGTGTAHGLVVT